MQGPGELTALDLVRRCHAALYAAASLPAGLEQLRTIQPALGAVAQLYRTYTVVMPPDRRCVGRTSLLHVFAAHTWLYVCCTASLAVHMAYFFGCHARALPRHSQLRLQRTVSRGATPMYCCGHTS